MRRVVVLDAGALIALERRDARTVEAVRALGRRMYRVVAPILVVMEVLYGTRNTRWLQQVLAAIEDELPLSTAMGREIPGLRRTAGVGSDADASVVLEALARPGSVILTGDAGDIHALLDAAGAPGRVPVFRI